MDTTPVFGDREAKKALKKLGFIISESKGKGSHAKATHPNRKPAPERQRPFIIIKKRKEYSKPFREDFIKEIMAFGFTKDEVIKAFRK